MITRTKTRRFIATGAVGLLCLGSVNPVFAQAPSSEAAFEGRRIEAKAQFEKGAGLYKDGRYEAAVQAFLSADRLAPSPALSFNIARAYEKLNDISGALRWYRDYLRRAPTATNRGEVSELVASLDQTLSRRGLQQLTVLSTPTGAEVSVDGRPAGVTPYTADLSIGDHRVTLAADGFEEQGVDLTLSSNAPQEMNLNLKKAEPGAVTPPPAPIPEPPREPPAEEEGRRFGVAPYIVVGAGAAVLGGALAFELLRRSQETKAEDATTQLDFKDHVDTMNGYKTAARVTLGVGIAGVVTGGVLMLLNDKKERGGPPVAFGCFTDGCSASYGGAF